MQQLLEDYSLIIDEKVVWGEMDAFQHVNNTVYFRYFESIRIAYFEQAGAMEYFQGHNIGPILASHSCDFRAPLTYPDNIKIAARIDEIREKRFNIHCVVYSEKLNKIAAEGVGLVVYFDYNVGKSCPIPESIVKSINQLENL